MWREREISGTPSNRTFCLFMHLLQRGVQLTSRLTSFQQSLLRSEFLSTLPLSTRLISASQEHSNKRTLLSTAMDAPKALAGRDEKIAHLRELISQNGAGAWDMAWCVLLFPFKSEGSLQLVR